MKSLKDRIISAAVLLVFLAAVVVFNGIFRPALNIAVSIVSVMAIVEIVQALGMAKKTVLFLPSLVFAAVVPLLNFNPWQQVAYFVYMVILFSAQIFYHKDVTFREVGVIFSMAVLIPTALETLIGLRELGGSHGMFYVIIGILAAWLADVGAFFAGNFFGKHKLCPEISPKKTVEGLVGGFVFNIAAMLVCGWLFTLFWAEKGETVTVSYLSLALIGLGGAALSVVGDLSFSIIKRSCHIKDFSEILPGHGGILDRFDSVIFVAPFVYLLVQFFPILSA